MSEFWILGVPKDFQKFKDPNSYDDFVRLSGRCQIDLVDLSGEIRYVYCKSATFKMFPSSESSSKSF